MSDLTHSVKILILKPEGLNHTIVRASLVNRFDRFRLDEMPVLTFPANDAVRLNIPSEKIYNLWIWDSWTRLPGIS
jgi:hypothetical protein